MGKQDRAGRERGSGGVQGMVMKGFIERSARGSKQRECWC